MSYSEDYKRKYKDLTDREQAILSWLVTTESNDWKSAFVLSRKDDPKKYLEAKNLATAVSRWKMSAKVQSFYNEQKELYTARIAAKVKAELQSLSQEEAKAVKEGDGMQLAKVKAKMKFSGPIDFTDKGELLKFLNSKANEITDEKQRTDYIKLIADLVRLKAEDGRKKDDIRRFYMPLRCADCQLYEDAKNKER